MTPAEERALEQAALLEILEPTGAPQWAKVCDVNGWALRAAAKAIAHDLREPILGVRRLAGWLADLAPDEETSEAQRYRELLDQRLVRLEQRYDALRRFIEAGLCLAEAEIVATDEIVELACAAARKESGHVVSISSSGVASLETTRVPLVRCLTELVTNAAVHHGSESVTVAVEFEKRSGGWVVWVHDDGVGVAESAREDVFEPFVSLAGRAGMGLAIVRRTAALRGGWCEISTGERGGGCSASLLWSA